MSRLRTICFALLSGLALATGSLGRAEAQSTSFGWSQAPDTPQVSVAIDQGLWKKQGLDVDVSVFGTGRAALDAMLGGQVDFIIVAELPVVVGAMMRQGFTIVADLSRYHGNRLISTRPFASVKALSGLKIGTTLGTSLQFVLEDALQQADTRAVIVNAAPADLVTALINGDIDAALTFAGFVPQAQRILGARYHALPLPDQTHLFVVASRKVVENHPDVVKKFLAGLLEADKFVQANPAVTQDIIAQMSAGSLNVANLQADWSDYEFRMQLDGSIAPLLLKEGQWVAAQGMIRNVVPTPQVFAPYIDPAFLQALDPARVTAVPKP